MSTVLKRVDARQDQNIVPRALRNYWGEYLQTDSTE